MHFEQFIMLYGIQDIHVFDIHTNPLDSILTQKGVHYLVTAKVLAPRKKTSKSLLKIL